MLAFLHIFGHGVLRLFLGGQRGGVNFWEACLPKYTPPIENDFRGRIFRIVWTCQGAHHEFGFDHVVLVTTDWNVLFHQAEAVKAAQQESAAVDPKIEVHLLTTVSDAKNMYISGKQMPNNLSSCLRTYRLRSYWTFWVRSTLSRTKSWMWPLLKGRPGVLRARLLLHLRAPHMA